MSGMDHRPFFTVIYVVFALFVSQLAAQNSVQFYSSSSGSVSSTEQASFVLEQSEVATGRSINGGSSAQANVNPNDKPLRTTGFAFKDRNSLVSGRSSPVPFVIPSYASGIIFRDTDNDNSPRVEIQPSIDVSSKTISPEETNTATTSNVNSVSSFQPFQTTPSTSATEEQNISPNQFRPTTLPPSRINVNPTANEPRYSDVKAHIDILGLQAPGYAVRKDGTIDSEAIPASFQFNSNPINPIAFDAPTTTQRVTRTTQHQNTNPWSHPVTQTSQFKTVPRFVPSLDNPFLPRANLISGTESTTFGITTQPSFATTFRTSKQTTFRGFASTNGASIKNGFESRPIASTLTPVTNRNQHAISTFPSSNTLNAVTPIASGSLGSRNGNFISQNPSKFAFNPINNNFGNQAFPRQTISPLSRNTQQKTQQKVPFVINVDGANRSTAFATAKIPTTKFASSFTTKSPNVFTFNPTVRAPTGFPFTAFSTNLPTTIRTTARALFTTTPVNPTTNQYNANRVFSTIPTTFQSNSFTGVPTTGRAPVPTTEPSTDASEPSVELLPPLDSDTQAKSAFAPINEAGAQAKLNSPTINSRNQQPFTFKPFNTIKPIVRNNFLPTTASPRIPFKQVSFTSKFTTKPPVKFSTFFPTTTTLATTIAPPVQLNKPVANAEEPSSDLLPPEDSGAQYQNRFSSLANNVGNNAISSTASTTITTTTARPSFSLPIDDLLPPFESDNSNQNSNPSLKTAFSTVPSTTIGTTSTFAGIRTSERASVDTELNLDPFLPPADGPSNNGPTDASTESQTDVQKSTAAANGFTTITLEQNPFLPQLDLNPDLPPFFSNIKSTDAPPLAASASTVNVKTVQAPSTFGQKSTSAVLGNVTKSPSNAANTSQKSPQQQPTYDGVKYSGGFGGPPGILTPFDSNRG